MVSALMRTCLAWLWSMNQEIPQGFLLAIYTFTLSDSPEQILVQLTPQQGTPDPSARASPPLTPQHGHHHTYQTPQHNHHHT